ncbi:hypothetical protein [Gellertiella hungarica]|uniref:Uncharacterized protein n=1 Tax=Gellertiella hungarica TaxID=1572859 RepID=A0A7W6J6X4_9HYPH|nr:hypothetical protein [Gellertiella hungarica]MBB4065031.1 hypothetical protein [Gellertiella hungarica]
MSMLDRPEKAMLQDCEVENELKELASLARLVTFARERAHAINAEFPAYCLDLALGAILQEMYPGTGNPDFVADEREAWLRSMPH